MDWNRLKEEKCPKCGAALVKVHMYICRFCGFRISYGKVYEITGGVTDLQKAADVLLGMAKRKKKRKSKHRTGRSWVQRKKI